MVNGAQYQQLGPQMQNASTNAELHGMRDLSIVLQHLTLATMTVPLRLCFDVCGTVARRNGPVRAQFGNTWLASPLLAPQQTCCALQGKRILARNQELLYQPPFLRTS